MTLRNIGIGNKCVVEGTDLRNDTARRLEMLGLTRGTVLTLLNKKRAGAVIVKLRGTRFAFGKEIAEGIRVSPAQDRTGDRKNA